MAEDPMKKGFYDAYRTIKPSNPTVRYVAGSVVGWSTILALAGFTVYGIKLLLGGLL